MSACTIGNEVVTIDRAVIVQSRRHRGTPLVNHGAGGTGTNTILEVSDPTRVARLTGVPEAVVVQGEERSVEAAVRTDRGNIIVPASTADKNSVPGDRRVGANPLGSDVSPRTLTIAVWLVHWLEVDQTVVGILGRDRLPHGPEACRVVDLTVLRGTSSPPNNSKSP